MAVFSGRDLKALRKNMGISQMEIAEMVPCDVRTYVRYESCESVPDPETMWNICHALGDDAKWYDWMGTVYTSYRRMHPERAKNDLSGSVLRLYATVEELTGERQRIFKDASDGSVDETTETLKRAIDELLSVAQNLHAMLPK